MNSEIPELFPDPGQFKDQAEDSHTLPSSWYYDPDIYALEHVRIFYRTWWYQCHLSNLINPGDYYTGEIADQGIIVIRGQDNQLRAFYNVCSHRAHPLLQGNGNTRLITCPYHQWCYRSDGGFQGARGRQALEGWIPHNADLKPVRLEVYGGMVFVNLDPDAVPLAEQASQFLKDMYNCCPQLDDLVHVHRFERDIRANWKTVVDNNHECYHCDANHPSLMELVDYDNKAVWSDDGITFTHTVERKQADNSAYRLDTGTLTQDSLFGYIWPTLIPLFYPGSPSMVLFQVLPTGPETSRVRHDYFLLSREPSDQEQKLMDWFSHTLNVEDIDLCENVQKGLHSRGYNQGRFLVDRDHVEFSEHHVHFYQKMVKQALTA